MSNNFTPELSPDKGTQQNPAAAAFFDGTLWYIGNGHNTDIWAVYRSAAPDSLDPNESPVRKANTGRNTFSTTNRGSVFTPARRGSRGRGFSGRRLL